MYSSVAEINSSHFAGATSYLFLYFKATFHPSWDDEIFDSVSIINIPLRNYLSFSGPEVAGVASKWCRRLRVQKDTTENFKHHHFCMFRFRASRTPVIHCKFSHMNILCFIVFKFLWEPSVFLIWQNYSYNSTFEPVSSDLPEQWHRIILSMLQQTARNVWEMCLMSESLVLNLSTPVQ